MMKWALPTGWDFSTSSDWGSREKGWLCGVHDMPLRGLSSPSHTGSQINWMDRSESSFAEWRARVQYGRDA